jgi:hypothetical protein
MLEVNPDLDRAKRLLVHYVEYGFKKAGLPFDSDNKAELEDIVDSIACGVLREVRNELKEQRQAEAERNS